MKFLVITCLFFCSLFASAQPAPVTTSADIYMNLQKLGVVGSVLYVGAHPDDENTRLLTYLAKDRMYRTGYLSLTRGDGGQNLIGDEQGIELGLIRTQELLAARRIDGAEQFFTRAFDFGFSKGPEETFTKWDREKILSDVVWVIRKFRPDVIITRFPTTGEGGHGHHTASAILANEAFTAAADPKRFPEQLKWVQPWQAKRIMWNSFNTGGALASNVVKIDVGGYNALLGKSYGEIAGESRSQHKSQGQGTVRTRGEMPEYFTTTGGTPAQNDIMDGVVTDWSRVNGAIAVMPLLTPLLSSFDFVQPQKSVSQLVQLYKTVSTVPDSYWKEQKLGEIEKLIEQTSGLWLEAFTTQGFAAQQDSVVVTINANNRLGSDVQLRNIDIETWDTTLQINLSKNRNQTIAKRMLIPASHPITQPYWLENKMESGYYNVANQLQIGQADVDPAYVAVFTVIISGETFKMQRPVRYKYIDPVRGELYQPFVVLPKIALHFVNNTNVSINGAAVNVPVRLHVNHADASVYKVAYVHSKNWTNDHNFFNYASHNTANNEEISTVKPVQKEANLQEEISLTAIDEKGQVLDRDQHTIFYDHIPAITYFPPATAKLVAVNVHTLGKNIGYIIGAGDRVPEALEAMGYNVTLLTDKELARNNLQQYDAIISGVRAYNTNSWLNEFYDKLMTYVQNGGNLIVQYNTNNQQGPVRAKIGPYNFTISRNRVTDENAVVTFLSPSHPVLNMPNKIGPDDFKGWIQERSIYHATDLDAALQPILGMNDAGETSDNGSLVIGKFGKGYFTYTGLVFFRELPAGVPGTYRLLANLIALNQQKIF